MIVELLVEVINLRVIVFHKEFGGFGTSLFQVRGTDMDMSLRCNPANIGCK